MSIAEVEPEIVDRVRERLADRPGDLSPHRVAEALRAAGRPVGDATVWLVKDGGKWSGVGARVVPKKGETFMIGAPPKEQHRIDWD